MKDYEKRIATDSDAMFRFNFESKHPCFDGISEAKAREIWAYPCDHICLSHKIFSRYLTEMVEG